MEGMVSEKVGFFFVVFQGNICCVMCEYIEWVCIIIWEECFFCCVDFDDLIEGNVIDMVYR